MNFKFTTSNFIKYHLIVFLIAFFWTAGVVSITIYVKNIYLLILFMSGVPGLILLLRKFIFKVSELTVIFNDSGFELLELKRVVKWNEIDWCYYDSKGDKWFFNSLTIKLKNGQKINIFYFMKNKNYGDWKMFTDYFFKQLKQNCPNLRSYFDSKFWTILIYLLLGLNIVVPVLMLIWGVKPLQFMATWFSLVGFSTLIISNIRNNRSTAKQFKTYKEIQEEKQLKMNTK